MDNNFISKFGEFDVANTTVKEFMENENLNKYYDLMYYQVSHKNIDLSHERILKNVNAEDFYKELFNALAEGDLYENVIHSKDISNATKEFVDFVENGDISMEAKEMFIDGFKSSVEAEYIHAFEEEKEMVENLELKTFPKDGTIELATEKLVKAIAENKLDEKEIDFLSKEFRHNFTQKEKYGVATKLSLENYSKETLENGIKKGLTNDSDLLLDMQHSGQLVPVPKLVYSNDTAMLNDVAEENYKGLLNGELPSDIGSLNGQDAQIFYHNLLGDELYNSDKYESLREVGDDMDDATKEFMSIIKDEENKEEILEKFEEAVKEDAGDDNVLWETIMEGQQEDATITLRSKGFLDDTKEPETYLMLGSNINWRNSSRYSLKEVKDLDDIINSVTPDADYTIDITAKENTPYLEAMVYSHDVPTGSHVYILPESKWDEVLGYDNENKKLGKGYGFIEDFMNEGYISENIKEIFHAKRKEIEMDIEAENNPIVAEMKEVYDQYIYDNYSNTVEKFEDNGIVSAWEEVCEHFAEKLEDETQDFTEYKDYENLLIKFNPTLQSAETIANTFENDFKGELKYQYNIYIENKYDLERGYNYLKFANRDLSVSEIEDKFMKDIIETHGTNSKLIDEAIDIVTEYDKLMPHESAKLLTKTINSEAYKKAFDKEKTQSKETAR